MAVAELLQDARGGEARQSGATGKPEQRVLDDVIEVMRGAEEFETQKPTLLGEESISGGTQVRLGNGALLSPASERAWHGKGGA